MVINLHIYPSPFKFESRIIREANTLLGHNLVDKIIIASSWSPGLTRHEFVGKSIEVRRFKTLADYFLKYHKAFLALKYLELYIYISFFYLWRPLHIINSHSLMVLPIAIFLKKIKRNIQVIYDAHELETERFGLKGKAQRLSKFIERRLIYTCNKVIVVGEYIRRWYIKEYNLHENDIFTVRNLNNGRSTDITKNGYLKERFKLNEDDFIFIYQGLLSKGRGIDIYIETFKKLPSRYNLVLMGYGPLEETIIEETKIYPNIFFHPAVKPNEIVSVTSSAHVGLTLIENYCLSYYYSLPNKLFEYANSNLPIICSDFPEMSDLVVSKKIGWAIPPTTLALTQLLMSEQFLNEMQQAAEHIHDFNKELNWENEEIKLVNAYKSLN